MVKEAIYTVKTDATIERDKSPVVVQLEKWVIGFLVHTVQERSHPRFWSGNTSQWFEAYIDLQRQRQALLTDYVFDCPTDPPPVIDPPPPAIPLTGELGLTVLELELEVMSMIPQYRCNNGVIELWNNSCCEWETFCNVDAIAQGSNALFDEVGQLVDTVAQPLQSWADNLFSWGSNPVVPLQVDDPSIITGNWSRCVKATALVDAVYYVLEQGREALNANSNRLQAAIALVTGITAFFTKGETIDEGIRLLLWLEDIENAALADITAFLADDAQKEQIICETTLRMTYADEITGEDFSGLWLSLAAFELDIVSEVYEALGASPAPAVRKRAYEIISAGACACNEYIPETIPSLPAGSFRFLYDGLAQATEPSGGCGLPTTYAGELYAFALNNLIGVEWADLAKTQELCSVGGLADGHVAMLFSMSEPCTLTDINLQGLLGTSSSNPYVSVWAFIDSTQQWVVGGGASGLSGTPGAKAYDILSGTVNDVTFMVISIKTRNNPCPIFYVQDVLISGNYGGEPFVNLSVGAIHTP